MPTFGGPIKENQCVIICQWAELAKSGYRRALEGASFVDVSLTNRNPWYRTVAREELARLEGTERDAFLTAPDKAALDEQIGIWRAMVVVLDSGEHCPHHFRGRKP